MLFLVLSVLGTPILLLFVAASVLQRRFRISRKQGRESLLAKLDVSDKSSPPCVVGFFHPYCNAGGGGERVLWTAIDAMQKSGSRLICVVYTGDRYTHKSQDNGLTKNAIIEKIKARFDISLNPQQLEFVWLKQRWLVEDATWKRFTLMGQSLGSIFLTLEALSLLTPDVFIDTMGYAFSFPTVKLLANIPVAAYVHYPTISTNMLERVEKRIVGHSNDAAISSSMLRSRLKLAYYHMYAYLYSTSLGFADKLTVNSSWTQAHVNSLLPSTSAKADIIYPPCEVSRLLRLPLQQRHRQIFSLAQFRPEKEHLTQIQAFNKVLQLKPEWRNGPQKVELVMAGSVRNPDDEQRVAALKQQVEKLGIADNVHFIINATYDELINLFANASIGLSTMVDEHFGINIVEIMAAGLIPVVQASGGPLLDIVVPIDGHETGYHAATVDEFASKLVEAIELDSQAALVMRERARKQAQKFSQELFTEKWMECWRLITPRIRKQ